MSDNSSKRIIINTCAQYVRTILSMVLALVATRVILKSLGVEDYGIYSVVAGAVSILSFLTSSLVITTQRFLSVTQGEKDIEKTRKVFNNSILLHWMIALVVLFFLEIFYIFLFDEMLNIPEHKVFSAKVLYQFVALILCFAFITSPYRAVIVSHENIVYISLIETSDALLKLIIAYVLFFVSGDKLITYGALLIIIQIFNFLSLSIYSYSKYPECGTIKKGQFDLSYVKNLFFFAGWTMYNLVCNLGRTQGIAIALNRFYGPAINASYGLGFQVSGALNNVSASLLNAINPQLMKAEGAGDRTKVIRFAAIESKFAFFLLSTLAIPCLFEMPRLLELWLGSVPQYAVLFCRMVILAALADTLTTGLGAANQAVGKIRNFTLAVYTIKICTLPVAVLLLHWHCSLVYVAFAYVLLEFLSSIMRIPFVKKTVNLNIKDFVTRVFVHEIVPVAVNIVVCYLMISYIEMSYRFILTFGISAISYFIAIYTCGLCVDEKALLNTYLKRITRR